MKSTGKSKRGRPTRKDKRKKEILNTAEEVFVRKGFENTTMQDVANEANIGIATVFRFFPKKEQLIVENATKQFEYIRNFLIEVKAKPGRCIDKVEYIFDFIISMLDNEYHACFIILDNFDSYVAYEKSNLVGMETFNKVYKESTDIFGEIISEGIKDGSIKNIENADEYLKTIVNAFSIVAGKLSKQQNILLVEHEIGAHKQINILKEIMLSYLRKTE